MISSEKLLPSNSTPTERPLADVISANVPLPLRDIVDPVVWPPDWLPFLAAHESVDLWYEDWPVERKRRMVAEASELARLVGTRAALPRFLPYVDAEIIDRVSHPRRFVAGYSAIGVDPIGHRPFAAHLLVRVPIRFPSGAVVVGRTAVRFAATHTVDRKPLRRVRRAAQVAKSPETLVTINHGHRRPVTFYDGFPLDGSFRFGDFKDRKKL